MKVLTTPLLLAALAVGYQYGRQDHPAPPVMQTYVPPPPVVVPSDTRVLFVGPGKQTIVMVHEYRGQWEILQVRYAGAIVGELVRFNLDRNEAIYPEVRPALWTIHGGGRTY